MQVGRELREQHMFSLISSQQPTSEWIICEEGYCL